MDFLWDKITEWLKEMLIGGIVSNLSVILSHKKSIGLPSFQEDAARKRHPPWIYGKQTSCRLAEQTGQQRHEGNANQSHPATGHQLFHTKIGVKLCSMAGGGVSRNLWNFFRTAPAGTGQAVTCSTSGMGLRLK